MRSPGPTVLTIGNATPIAVERDIRGGSSAMISVGSAFRIFATRENLVRLLTAISEYLDALDIADEDRRRQREASE